jgi:hypothetical protein
MRHAANYTGARLGVPPGALTPEKVAAAIVDLARRPRDSTAVGAPVSLFRLSNVAAPNLIASGMNRLLDAWAKRAAPAPDTRGALYQPQPGASGMHSGERKPVQQRHPALVLGAVALGVAVGAQLLRRRR